MTNNHYLINKTFLAVGSVENTAEAFSIECDRGMWGHHKFLNRIKTGTLSLERKQIVEKLLLKLKRAFATRPYDVGQNELPGKT